MPQTSLTSNAPQTHYRKPPPCPPPPGRLAHFAADILPNFLRESSVRMLAFGGCDRLVRDADRGARGGGGAKADGHSSSDPWNYFHINSIDKNSDGDYLVSARNYATVFKINGTTGDIIWQLGGAYSERSNFSIPVDAHFNFQHNARFISQSDDGTIETITIFDNSAHSRSAPVAEFSRGLVLQLNQTSRSAAALRTQPAPDNLSAKSQESLQLLPNGHTFINWGEAGAVSEFGADDSLLFHAYLDSAPAGKLVQSHRATKSNWTELPTEELALAALNGTAYVS
ncbi:ASST-domain-containing protein [Macrophomina phaseolina]|uniref:ASST-domain-containing protein n=1 Tax=Macrophomina phaseolina TaxID=35725 RepID=A0ABQ8FTE8_9PEZI|nr:ASST-domain-containing protein [Macrophomina phaseolina]